MPVNAVHVLRHLLLLDGFLAVLKGKATAPRNAVRECQRDGGESECEGRRELHLGLRSDQGCVIGVATC